MLTFKDKKDTLMYLNLNLITLNSAKNINQHTLYACN